MGKNLPDEYVPMGVRGLSNIAHTAIPTMLISFVDVVALVDVVAHADVVAH